MTAHDCPDCRCWTPDDERPPMPAASNAWARRAALEATEAAVRKARERRGAPFGEGGRG